MSFGIGIGDIALVLGLAYSAYEGAKQACGNRVELVKEMHSHCGILQHLYDEIDDPESLIHKAKRQRRRELQNHIDGCEKHLKSIHRVLKKFNALSPEEKGGSTLLERLRFGIGGIKDIAEMRTKLTTYTSCIAMSLNLLQFSSQGRMEHELGHLRGEVRDLRENVDLVLAKRGATAGEGSISTHYASADRAFWRSFCQELVQAGFSNRAITQHKDKIKAYVKELADKKILDDMRMEKTGEEKLTNDLLHSNKDSHRSLKPNAVTEEKFVVEASTREGSPVPTTNSPVENVVLESTAKSYPQEYSKHIAPEAIQSPAHGEIPLAAAPPVQLKFEKVSYSKENTNDVKLAVTGTPITSHIQRSLGETAQSKAYTMKTDNSPCALQYAPDMAQHLPFPNRRLPKKPAQLLSTVETWAENVSPPLYDDAKQTFRFKDALERDYLVPLEMMKSWTGMRDFIVKRFKDVHALKTRVDEGQFDLFDHEKHQILPDLWEDVIKPDMYIEMQMSKISEPLHVESGHSDTAGSVPSTKEVPESSPTKTAAKSTKPPGPVFAPKLPSVLPSSPARSKQRKSPPASLLQMWSRPARYARSRYGSTRSLSSSSSTSSSCRSSRRTQALSRWPPPPSPPLTPPLPLPPQNRKPYQSPPTSSQSEPSTQGITFSYYPLWTTTTKKDASGFPAAVNARTYAPLTPETEIPVRNATPVYEPDRGTSYPIYELEG